MTTLVDHKQRELKVGQKVKILKNIPSVDGMVEDYIDIPSEMSGSVVNIHENSPFMNEMYSDTGWKHVIHGSVEEAIEAIKNKKT